MKAIWFALLFSATAASGETISYDLDGLQPSGVSEYPAGLGSRLYLQFHNEDGSHYLVYDEAPTVPPLKKIERLQLAMAHHGTECSLQVECTTKAFCTDDCHHLYYEMTNAPTDPAYADRNRCHLISYSCERASPRSVASSAATASPPAVPASNSPPAGAPPPAGVPAAPASTVPAANTGLPEEP